MGDGSTEHKKMTAGLDLGDRYSHLCVLDAEGQPKIAIEVGTNSPWTKPPARRVRP